MSSDDRVGETTRDERRHTGSEAGDCRSQSRDFEVAVWGDWRANLHPAGGATVPSGYRPIVTERRYNDCASQRKCRQTPPILTSWHRDRDGQTLRAEGRPNADRRDGGDTA